MMELLIATLVLAGIWVGVTGWFFAFGKAKELKNKGITMPWYITVPIYVYLAMGLVLDVLWNVIFGTFIFLEFPRELLFTSRVQRHKNKDFRSWRRARAEEWGMILNHIDEGHIK